MAQAGGERRPEGAADDGYGGPSAGSYGGRPAPWDLEGEEAVRRTHTAFGAGRAAASGATAEPPTARIPAPVPAPGPAPAPATVPAPATGRTAGPEPAPPPVDEETVALRLPAAPAVDPAEPAAPAVDGGTPAAGGRAARRRAAQSGGRHGSSRHGGGRRARRTGGAAPPPDTAASPAAGGTGGAGPGPGSATTAPRSRLEARRLERARKDSPGIIASRFLGETFITLGVLMLLFVTYQLWWTNVLAGQQAGGTASNLQKQWDEGDEKVDKRDPGAFSPGEGFAIMYIPKLDVKVPIAEGIDKHKVLDRGLAGHYAEGKLKTAMPWDETGNFAVAGHRNTHGEPFRYINKLKPGDEIIVETRDTFYIYAMASILPQTPPSNISVIEPVPKQSGFTEPGRYVTLTTCTPEFTSTYRMIVWGKMVDERPRSEGKPDALVG
ncbi:class E sortase [Streptomyces sp. PLAI1-29]|uniref:Class E sortase n=1 Tax=Streptomyces zingiberis TaxID=2053010 RepID=A0ABX1BVJ4_9ACTN|nr:class E sortase [Streptomyces zingiberis]